MSDGCELLSDGCELLSDGCELLSDDCELLLSDKSLISDNESSFNKFEFDKICNGSGMPDKSRQSGLGLGLGLSETIKCLLSDFKPFGQFTFWSGHPNDDLSVKSVKIEEFLLPTFLTGLLCLRCPSAEKRLTIFKSSVKSG